MSDRVRFATWNNTADAADSTFFSGFPFPQVVHDGDLSLPMEQMDQWCWRIRGWSVQVSFNANYFRNGFPIEVSRLSLSYTSGGGTDGRQRELDIIERKRPGVLEVGTGSGYKTIDAGGIVHMNSYDWASSFSIFSQYYYETSHGLFSPSFDFTLTTNIGYQVSTDNDPFPDQAGSVSIDGRSARLYGYTHTGALPNPDAWIDNVFVRMTPISYWPYAAENGTPIYDTATGAALQSPRN